MRDDEEYKALEKDFSLDVAKSSIAKGVKIRCVVGMIIPPPAEGGVRKKNTEIQTYNVDYLV